MLDEVCCADRGLSVTIVKKYVNMADINFDERWRANERATDFAAKTASEGIAFEMIELLFFAYRDFVSDPDMMLSRYQFGRAHHRVLHFVNRHPGLSVADLLDILKITKQSLSRVIKPLIEQGFIEQRTGETDRRQRLLYATEKGRALALELARAQTVRIARAIREAGPEHEISAKAVLMHLVNPEERTHVRSLIDQPAAAATGAPTETPDPATGTE